MIYCGQGGLSSLGCKLPLDDQKLSRGNRALKNSLDEKTPVCVIQKVEWDEKNDVFVYYGLYTVNNYTREKEVQKAIWCSSFIYKGHMGSLNFTPCSMLAGDVVYTTILAP